MSVRPHPEKQIISEIFDRQTFHNLLRENLGLIILKLGAEWCGPCKRIEPIVHSFFATTPPEVICGDIDVDRSFDLYSYLRSKKMVNGVPVMLCYRKGNTSFIPDESVTGSDPNSLHKFFIRCGQHLAAVKSAEGRA